MLKTKCSRCRKGKKPCVALDDNIGLYWNKTLAARAAYETTLRDDDGTDAAYTLKFTTA